MIKKKIIYSLIIILSFLALYLYSANAFIYYRIGQGGLIAPSHHISYYMNQEPIGPKIKYIALGDSLTFGVGAKTYEESYPYLLAQKMLSGGQNIVLENFSAPGAKTKDLIDVLLTPAIKAQPDIVTVLIGVNDIHNHIGLEQFKKNYQYILNRLTKETRAKIYLINIPAIGSNTIIVPPLDYYFSLQTDNYNEVIKDLAAQYQASYIDLNSPTKNLLKEDGAHYSVDSFHPSALGYKLWAQIIYDSFNN